MCDNFLTPLEPCEFTLREKGSVFRAFLFPIESFQEGRTHLASLRKQFHDATHHVPAFRVLVREEVKEFCSDDGEPTGTAGSPELDALRAGRLVNVGLIVIRWFGGTKLGKPGLRAAYSEAAHSCILAAKTVEIVPQARFLVTFPWEETGVVVNFIDTSQARILSQTGIQQAEWKIELPAIQREKALSAFLESGRGKIHVEEIF